MHTFTFQFLVLLLAAAAVVVGAEDLSTPAGEHRGRERAVVLGRRRGQRCAARAQARAHKHEQVDVPQARRRQHHG